LAKNSLHYSQRTIRGNYLTNPVIGAKKREGVKGSYLLEVPTNHLLEGPKRGDATGENN